jgi:PAS domain S-box-containing protein
MGGREGLPFQVPLTGEAEAARVLLELAGAFLRERPACGSTDSAGNGARKTPGNIQPLNVEARYRILVEQIPAVVFMAYLDQGISEAYVSPQIEAVLGFTQEEWLNDPVRWFHQIHPDDKARWSVEASQMFLSRQPLRSVYRVLARDGRVIWFHCEAKMVRSDNDSPWLIHGVAFDVTELKQAEEALKRAHDELEMRVRDRTSELAAANAELQSEMAERTRAQEALRMAHDGLEMRVRKRTSELARSNEILQAEILERAKAEGALRASEAALRRREEELRALTAKLLSIQDSERRRIARELHDGTAQNLAGLGMNLSLLLNSPTVGREGHVRGVLLECLTLTEQCSREVRNLSYLLHPPLLDDLGLASALKSYIAGFSHRTRIGVALEMPPDLGRLAPEAETMLFRIVQEGLANVHRHSGSSRAAIRISLTASEVKLEVKDEGSGHAREAPGRASGDMVRLGVGIPGMRERAEQLGGRMDIDFGSGGTIVTVTLPLGSE